MKTEILQFFAKYIEENLGIMYNESNAFQLEKRILEIAKLESGGDPDALFAQVRQGMSTRLHQRILDVATNNETSFFRDPKLFELLQNRIFPDFVKAGISPINVWSAAASTGQEIYSFLMTHGETAPRQRPELGTLVATDISESALERARTGIYATHETHRGLTPELLRKYFRPLNENRWQVRPDLAAPIRFCKQNLLSPFEALGKFHIILCRNVLIYQKVESKRIILERLHRQVASGGVLLLGAGESMIGITDLFEPKLVDGVSVFLRKEP